MEHMLPFFSWDICFLSFVLMTTIRHGQNFRHLPCSIRSRRNATSTCKTKSLSGSFGPFRSVEGYGSQDVPRTVALPQAVNGYIARVPFRTSGGQSAVEECPIWGRCRPRICYPTTSFLTLLDKSSTLGRPCLGSVTAGIQHKQRDCQFARDESWLKGKGLSKRVSRSSSVMGKGGKRHNQSSH